MPDQPVDPLHHPTMSKRGGESAHMRSTKVKKRKGVGYRTITIPDSDEEGLPPTASKEFARVTKTRIGTSGKVEGVSMSSVPIFERPGTPVPQEENPSDSVDVVKCAISAVPAAKQPKRVNDSVS